MLLLEVGWCIGLLQFVMLECVKWFEECGIIVGYGVWIDLVVFGLGMMVIIWLKMIYEYIKLVLCMFVDMLYVIEVYCMIGDDCFLLKVLVLILGQFEMFIDVIVCFGVVMILLVLCFELIKVIGKVLFG